MSDAQPSVDVPGKGLKGSYQSFIGLEVHIHLLTKTKGFCGCRSAFGDEPNTNVCPGCLGYPGTLPTLNIEALRMASAVARALNCKIPEKTWFERKQYFYPDLSKNFQLSQFASPIGRAGYLDIEGKGSDGETIKKRVRIKQCHLEEDAGKMIHTGTVSLLDYNRAGVALLEIVSEPDLETGEEAELYVQQLRRLVRYLGVCDGNMEEGSLRADANVSINHQGAGLGNRVEIKNLNSSRFIRLGLNYEIARHSAIMDAGKTVVQETRLWNENRDETLPMRKKENANDYRYLAEPDIPVFIVDEAFLKTVDDSLVELPSVRMARFRNDYGLSFEQADLICAEKEEADYFEAAVSACLSMSRTLESLTLDKKEVSAKIANYLLTAITHILRKDSLSPKVLASFSLTPERLAKIVALQSGGKLSTKNAKEALEISAAENRDPEEIIRERGWELLSDPAAIAVFVKEVYAAEEKVFAEAAAADDPKRRVTLAAFLLGKALKKTGGRADPAIARKQIEELIAGKL